MMGAEETRVAPLLTGEPIPEEAATYENPEISDVRKTGIPDQGEDLY